jgi:hypothetical protein
MGVYKDAMMKVACAKPTCLAAVGESCGPTTAVVHPVRRIAAIDAGFWSVAKALAGEYGSLAGEPLEALKPEGKR